MAAFLLVVLVFADGRMVVDGLECGAETAALYRLEEGRLVETLEARAEYRLDERGSVLRLGPGVRLRVAARGGFEVEGGAAVIEVRGRRRYWAGCLGEPARRLQRGVHRLDCGGDSSEDFWGWSEQRGALADLSGGGGWPRFGWGGGRRARRAPSVRAPREDPERAVVDEPKKLLPKGCRVVSRRALRRARRRVGEMRVVDLACRCRGDDCVAP